MGLASGNWQVARNIGDRIRRLRELLGREPSKPLSQDDLGKRAGVRGSQVSQWERGVQRPSRSRLERWAEREGWPVAVFSEQGPPPDEIVPPAPPEAREASGPDALLAQFYQMMADSATQGRPFPPELAHLMHAMHRLATGRRPDVPGW